MKFLIPTEPDDTHALLVKTALEGMGHHVRLLFTADQPTKQKNSIYIDNSNYHWKCSDKKQSIIDNDYDVVWWRRPRKPFVDKTLTHPDDYKFVVRENSLFYDSLTYSLAPDAWWVNDKEAANRANSKLIQLKTAVDCGMNIPVTIFSNDPIDIRTFALNHEKEGIIYKPLCSSFWFEDDKVKISYTSHINFMGLPTNSVLQLAPGIYQKEIKKKYELRVNCFGNYIVAAKLNSQVHENWKTDWRSIPHGMMDVEPYELPEELKGKIRLFMQDLGLVFGCLDFIVSAEGEYIFLEVNEQGQFLWLEECNPELKMLDIFVNFIITKSIDFSWNPAISNHSVSKYQEEIVPAFTENMRNHINLNTADYFK